jgi:glycosyltransferase involved in cell wall biosynthesis
MKTSISVIIVTHNRAKLLTVAMDSVLEQSFKDWELFIIDDDSSDNTELIVKPYLSDERVKYFKILKQKSIAAVRNFIWPYVKGVYIAVLDSDDVWIDQNKLQKQYDFLEGNLDVVLLGGAAIKIDEKRSEINRVIKPLKDEDIKKELFVKNPFFHSSVMFRWEAVAPPFVYDEKISFGEDWDLWFRLGEKNKLANLSDYLISYRVHNDNEASKHGLKAVLDVFQVIKRYRRLYGKSRIIYVEKIFRKLLEYLG